VEISREAPQAGVWLNKFHIGNVQFILQEISTEGWMVEISWRDSTKD
jgi:hypothetical protein